MAVNLLRKCVGQKMGEKQGAAEGRGFSPAVERITHNPVIAQVQSARGLAEILSKYHQSRTCA
jgi:hypothetical protein